MYLVLVLQFEEKAVHDTWWRFSFEWWGWRRIGDLKLWLNLTWVQKEIACAMGHHVPSRDPTFIVIVSIRSISSLCPDQSFNSCTK